MEHLEDLRRRKKQREEAEKALVVKSRRGNLVSPVSHRGELVVAARFTCVGRPGGHRRAERSAHRVAVEAPATGGGSH